MLEIRTFAGGGFGENCYLMWQSGGSAAVAIDPGADANGLILTLQTEQLELEGVLLTHAHIDHVEGIAALRRHATAPLYLHPADRLFYDNAAMQAAQFGMRIDPLPAIDHELSHEQRLRLADISVEVRHVPGHSPGHVMFYIEEAGAAFVGDVVFEGSIGRTDLPGGEYQQLMRSIRAQVMTLPDTTTLYPGHGPATTVAQERAFNPFIAPLYGGDLA
jgi:glyoxylase-like metal-dependent hydrolase (beta-lactamase superfamily II)